MALIAHWKMDETTGTALVDDTGTLANGTLYNTPTLGVTGADGTAISFDGVNESADADDSTQLAGLTAWTVSANIKTAATLPNFQPFFLWTTPVGESVAFQFNSNKFYFRYLWDSGGFDDARQTTNATVDVTDWTLITVTVDHATDTIKIYINGTEVASTRSGSSVLDASFTASSGTYYFASNGASQFFEAAIDDVRIYNTALSGVEVAALPGGPGPAASSLPMALYDFLLSDAASLPMRLLDLTESPAGSLPMNLEEPDPAHYLASVAHWAPLVTLDYVNISSSLVDTVDIEHEENASGLATFVFLPGTGAIDLSDYERKKVRISFVGKDAAGATLYTIRRFTGITSAAVIDPDAGTITVEATTDLQGRIENLSRANIAQLLGGAWSAHVFNDSADGWTYAKDRMSTQTKEMHVDIYGRVVTTDWAAKATQDVTLTDAERFGDTLALSRANRRDLITRVVINFDFRFSRLRHREVTINFLDQLGFCHYLNNNWHLPSKAMINTAADGTAWTRTTNITYTDLPGINPSVCNPPRAWLGGAELFCLGAWWKAARRWAQTVTEEYTLTVYALDLEEAIGAQTVNDDYGVEATYDATDYEAVREFTGPPDGASFDSDLQDWVLPADDSEFNGRTEMEAAQECALDKAKAEILGRARGNRVTLANVYSPSITLESTVRVNTPYLVCKGKVARYSERLDIDTGEPSMSIEVALSRHGGSGLASDDPLDAPAAPAAAEETPTARTLYLPYHLGGEEFSAVEDEDWDGYMCNVSEILRFAGAPVYEPRFVVKMPEIEETARDTSTTQQPVTFELEVPEDELTVSN